MRGLRAVDGAELVADLAGTSAPFSGMIGRFCSDLSLGTSSGAVTVMLEIVQNPYLFLRPYRKFDVKAS